MASVSSAVLDRQSVDVSADKTLAEGDSGVVQNVIADGKIITLPATVVGMTFVVRNGGAKVTNGPAGSGTDGSVLVSISPNAADKIMGANFTSADNKDAQNTKATARVGDFMRLVGDGVNGWFVQEFSGTWVRET